MKSRNDVVLAIAAILFLIVMAMEWMFPLNVVGAFGFVLPILLVATVRSRRLMVVTLALCILVTFVGLFQPGKKRERFTAVVFNRIMVACVLTGVAYIGVTWEERKAREEAAKAALATQTEHLLLANTQLVEIKDKLARSERLAAVGNWWRRWRMRSGRRYIRLPGMWRRSRKSLVSLLRCRSASVSSMNS